MPTPQPAPVTPKVTWLTHEFDVNLQSANWRAVAGLYIFAAKNLEGKWFPLYIGQATSYKKKRRLGGHTYLLRQQRKPLTYNLVWWDMLDATSVEIHS